MTPWTVAHKAPCPWDFPGKNTGVGCHFFLQGSSWPRDWTRSPALAGGFFTTEPSEKSLLQYWCMIKDCRNSRYSLSVNKLPWWQEQSQCFPQLCGILTSYTGSSQTSMCWWCYVASTCHVISQQILQQAYEGGLMSPISLTRKSARQRATWPRQSWHSTQVLFNIKAQQFHSAAYREG